MVTRPQEDTYVPTGSGRHRDPTISTKNSVKVKPALPNEIQDYILDFLHDSKPTLKTCALVCRAWVPTSRYHLFSKITVYGQDAASTLEGLIKNPNCTIRHSTACSSDTTMITRIAHVLQHLAPSSLHLVYLAQPTLATTTPFPSIVCLHTEVRYPTHAVVIVTLVDLFAVFPNIRELYMMYFFTLPHSCDRDYMPCPPRLHSLGFLHCDTKELLRWFIENRIAPSNVLSIVDLDADEVSIVGEYFSKFGNVLQEIRIELSRYFRQGPDILAAFCDRARLECLTGLQCLTIDTCYLDGSQFSSTHIKLFASIVEKIPSTLKNLCFRFPTPSTSPRLEEWHRIGELLQRRRFSQSTELMFSPTQPSYGHVEKWIREDLSAFEERGVLSVRHTEPVLEDWGWDQM